MSSAQCRGVQGSAGRCRAGRAHAKTQHVLNQFAGDVSYDEDACQCPIRKHVRHHTWNTSVPTYDEYMKCLRAPKNKSAGPDGVPPHLLRHIRKQLL